MFFVSLNLNSGLQEELGEGKIVYTNGIIAGERKQSVNTNCATTDELDRSDQESNCESQVEVEAGSGRLPARSSSLISLSPSLSFPFSIFLSVPSASSCSSLFVFSLLLSSRLSRFGEISVYPRVLFSLFLQLLFASLVFSVAYLYGSRSFVVQQVIFFRSGISSSCFSTSSRRSSFPLPSPLSFGFYFP